METCSVGSFFARIDRRRRRAPREGQLELTYRCNFSCPHCYARGSEDAGRELSTAAWKRIVDDIRAEGCPSLTLTGGEAILRPDFPEIYRYAKERGFLVTVFTNAFGLTPSLFRLFERFPPLSIEVTLNALTPRTFGRVTGRKGAGDRVLANIRRMARMNLPLSIKSNVMKENCSEIPAIKAWTERLLGRPGDGRYFFRYDPMIYPRLNGDTDPCRHRLSFRELEALRRSESDIVREHEGYLKADYPPLPRDPGYLFQCDIWKSQFVVDPYGRLKICQHTDRCSVDLKTVPFRDGFTRVFPRIRRVRFKTDSCCRSCRLRPICFWCPARARAETGHAEKPVPYYCSLAQGTMRRDKSGVHFASRTSCAPS